MDFADLGKALIGMGPGGVLALWMGWMWKLERDERIALQAANTKMLEDTVSSRHELASALERIADKVKA